MGEETEVPSCVGTGPGQREVPSCRDQEGRRGPDVVVLGTSVFTLSQTGVARNF